MSHLMINPFLYAEFAVIAVLVGPLARMPIDLGAWLLERLTRRLCRTETEEAGS